MKKLFCLFIISLLIISCGTDPKETSETQNQSIDEQVEKQKEFAQSIIEDSGALSANWKNYETLEVTYDPNDLAKNKKNDNDKVYAMVLADTIATKGHEYLGKDICVEIYYPDGEFVTLTCVKDE